MYSLSKIKTQIRQYKINQILNSGENDMFDNKIDIQKVKQYLQEDEKKELITKENNCKINLNKTLNDIESNKLLESIINLKNSHVE